MVVNKLDADMEAYWNERTSKATAESQEVKKKVETQEVNDENEVDFEEDEEPVVN